MERIVINTVECLNTGARMEYASEGMTNVLRCWFFNQPPGSTFRRSHLFGWMDAEGVKTFDEEWYEVEGSEFDLFPHIH